ncbi:RidA family protein [Rhodococcoides yunnanense]|uniref:RidA family protein n=1 Tax=Rhodococcoides yunnanense TaxID=278209 RepID=UPI0009338B26|nr:RidA family protein [Rhodococcus yunnanensis]
MSNRTNVSSGSEWEPKIGYSRAVRIGNHIAVSGTTGQGVTVAEQARSALATIEQAVIEAGGSLQDVIRTRIYLRDVSQWQEVAAVHGEIFGSVRPAATLLGVNALIDDALLVEIEADAIVS